MRTRLRHVCAVLGLLVGCDGTILSTDEEYRRRRLCGDGICQPWESCSSCPADCLACVHPDAAAADAGVDAAPDGAAGMGGSSGTSGAGGGAAGAGGTAGSAGSSGPAHYIAADGSDANDGAAKTTPWAHLPGMPGCSDRCAAYDPAPGEQFILKGGDTWGNANMGIGWSWGGTADNPIYIGVDETWYSGSAWTRPIWSCGGAPCPGNGNLWTSCNRYFTLDNIEMTGLRATPENTGPAYVEACGDHQVYENLYIHGWSRDPAVTSDDMQAFGGNAGYDITGTTFHDNVVDGFDTTQDMLVCFFLGIPIAYNNVCRYMTNGFEAMGNDWHDNLVEYLEPCFTADGCHQNFMFHFGPYSGTDTYLYNNVIRHATWQYSGGAPKLWLVGNFDTCTGCVTYAYNNVIYDQQPGNYLNICDHPPASDGTFYLFNNTFQVGSDSNPGGWWWQDPPAGSECSVHFANNHWIATEVSGCVAGTQCSASHEVVQTQAQANAAGENDTSEPFAFSPIGATDATVGAGANLSQYCAGELAALCRDTSYPSYDPVAHRVILRTTVARPGSAAWDVGAYQFAP
jgi:hypothetical protein